MPASSTPSLHVTETGPAGAPALLFLHGGGVGAWMWQPVIQRLPGYHCLAVDLPEHGGSRGVGPFSMELAASLAAAAITERVGAGRAVVVGLSEGAQVAVQMLAQSPQVMDRAVISSALLRPLPGAGWVTPGVLRWTYRLAVAPLRGSDAWIRLNMKHSAGIPDIYYAQFKDSFQAMTESGFANLMAANLRYRLPAGLEKAYVPTLIVVGAKEYPAMRRSALDLESALPDARAVQLSLGPKAKLAEEHNWALTRPDLFAQTVRAWIEGTPLPAELAPLRGGE